MNRKTYIDALRGIGIILVVLGHCQIHHGLLQWLYAFHMPLFFFLSGYAQRLSKNQKMGLGGGKKLLYPYYVVGMVEIIYNTLKSCYLNRSFSVPALNKRMIALMYGNSIWENNYDYIGTLWFLVALFCVKALYTAVTRVKERKYRHLMALCVVLVGCLWTKVFAFGIRLPFSFDVALLGFGFYYLGTEPIFHTEKTFYSIGYIVICVATLMVGSCLAFLNCQLADIDSTNMYGMTIGYPMLYFPTALLIIFALLGICKAIYSGKRASALKILPAVGRRSLLIMAFHIYVMQIFNYALNDILGVGLSGYVTAVLDLVLTYIAAVFVERYMPFMYKLPRKQEN